MDILFEYYMGNKSDSRFKKCEDCIQEIIDMLEPLKSVEKRYDLKYNQVHVGSSRANKELCKHLAGIFNITSVQLFWDRGMVNAYTYPPTCIQKYAVNNNLKKRNDGKVFLNAYVCVFEDIITQANLTAREVLAVILHELGHNFSFIPLGIMTDVVRSTLALPFIVINKLAMHVGGFVDKVLIEKLPEVSTFMRVCNDAFTTLSKLASTFGPINVFAGLLTGKYRLILPDPISSAGLLGGYADEKFSDNLAARYGYGADLVAALHKFNTLENSTAVHVVNKSGLGNQYKLINSYNDVINEFLGMITLRVHPSKEMRYRNMRNKLMQDLKNGDYPKEYKEALEKDIKAMDKVHAEYSKLDENSLTDVRKTYYTMINTLTKNNPDFREIFAPILNIGNNI